MMIFLIYLFYTSNDKQNKTEPYKITISPVVTIPEDDQIRTPKFTFNDTQQNSQHLKFLEPKEQNENQSKYETNQMTQRITKCNFSKLKDPTLIVHKKNTNLEPDSSKHTNIQENKENIKGPFLNFVSFDQEYKSQNKFQ